MAQRQRWQDDPAKLRLLVALVGVLVLLVLSAVLWLRRVDPVEVGATLLFLPVFLAVVAFRLPGGLIGGVVASVVYTVMRLPAMQVLGAEDFVPLIVGRSTAYLAFGALGGWAVGRLQRSLTKLDLYDQIDDDTGLCNARFLVDGLELERQRAQRYQTLFSVVALDIPAASIDAMAARQRRRLLRAVGQAVEGSVRAVDRAVHLRQGEHHRFVLLLPETPTEGAGVFAERFRTAMAEELRSQGADVDQDALRVDTWTVPGDEDGIDALRGEARELLA